MLKKKHSTLLAKSLLTCSLALASYANATIVEFATSQGKVTVNLFDQTTPKTVDNFLQYVDENHYTNSVIHRVSPGFIVQGGGFEFAGELPLTALVPKASVINEPVYSNVKGTIAMAKRGNDQNSATNQWFFNLNDNSANLDLQNGGFTVFGQVIEGMDVVEKIGELPLCFKGADGSGVPVKIDASQTCESIASPGLENFILVEQITIIDSSEVTDADLSPKKNTLITAPPVTPEPPKSSDGGSLGWLALIALGLANTRRLLFKPKFKHS